MRNDYNKSLLTAPSAEYSEQGEAMIRYLLELGLDPNYATPADLKRRKPYWTPLMIAANSGNTVRCQSFLAAGANPTTKNRPGRTAAMIAERNGTCNSRVN